MKGLGIGLALALAALSGGCATITQGTEEVVHITSNPGDVEARLSNGQYCRTPCALKVARRDEFFVTFQKEGYEPQEVKVIARVGARGAAAGIAGNAILGGLIGFGVDVATGASLEHCPNPVSVILKPLPRYDARGRPIHIPQTMPPKDPTAECKLPDPAAEPNANPVTN